MMGLSAEKRAYYEEHVQAWRNSGLSQIKIVSMPTFYMQHSSLGLAS